MGKSLPELFVGRITIIDATGRKRIDLGLDPDGEPAITLFDRNGQQRARLALRREPPDHDGEAPDTHSTATELLLTASDRSGDCDGGQAILSAYPSNYAALELLGGPDGQRRGSLVAEVSEHVNLIVTDGLGTVDGRVCHGTVSATYHHREAQERLPLGRDRHASPGGLT